MGRNKDLPCLVARRRRSKNLFWWCAGVLAVCSILFSAKCSDTLQHYFPKTTPHELAHLLSDFNNYRRLYPNIDTWMLESEISNYTSWHYKVKYGCGAWCNGRATVTLLTESKLQRLSVEQTECHGWRWILNWCDEWGSEADISGEEKSGIAKYKENAWRSCSILRILFGSCASMLRDTRQDHLQRIRHLVSGST